MFEHHQMAILNSIQEMMDGRVKVSERIRESMGLEDLPLAASPAEVIYTKDRLRLLKYTPEVQRHETPILFVYSLINRYYILDFLPGRSLIGFMLEQGFPVYCIDWGKPGDEEAELGWDHYLGRYLRRCVRKALRDSGAPDLTMYGYCMGGLLALAYVALYPEGIRNLVVQATPVDFSHAGILADWTRADHFNVDTLVDVHGNIPPALMEGAFQFMDPVGIGQKWETFAQNLDNRSFATVFLALEHWASDNIPFPGEVYRQYIKDFYQTNRFMRGEMEIGGRRVDLGAIRCPVLTITASKDTIVPPESAEVLPELVGADDTRVLRCECGHIGLATSSKGRRLYWPQVAGWIGERSLAGVG